MTSDCLVISIRTRLGGVVLANGKSAGTDILRAVHGRPGAYVCIFILSWTFYHLSFKFMKETKKFFLVLHEASAKARIQREFPDTHVNIIVLKNLDWKN